MIMTTGINDNTSYPFVKENADNYLSSYYTNSYAKKELENWFNDALINYDNYISQEEYCEAAKVRIDESHAEKLGNVSMKLINSYSPTFKCSNDANNYGIVKSKIGLITVDEAIYAGGYADSVNLDYYLNMATTRHILTMSPVGLRVSSNIYDVWFIRNWSLVYNPWNNQNGSLGATLVNDTSTYYASSLVPVINIISNASVTGSGTSSDPYKITGIEYNSTYDATVVKNEYSSTIDTKTATLATRNKSCNGNGSWILHSTDTMGTSTTWYYLYCSGCPNTCPGGGNCTARSAPSIQGQSCSCSYTCGTEQYYKCDDGYTLNGTTCSKATCPNGGTLSSDGKTCDATTYRCKDDDILSGTKCIKYSDTITFDYTGKEQTLTISKTGTYKLEVWGAQGGSTERSAGGVGGYSVGNIHLNKGEKIYINIGESPNSSSLSYNGGGSGTGKIGTNPAYGAGGGGATHISTASGLLSTLSNQKDSILIVAGGGGGGYINYGENAFASGGYGGGYIGGHGYWKGTSNGGATQSSGNAFGLGGSSSYYSAGGGGGYYGGKTNSASGAAAGGSGYIGNSLLTNKAMYCYNCSESTAASTKTISTTCNANLPVENCAKQGNGYAKITLISEN